MAVAALTFGIGPAGPSPGAAPTSTPTAAARLYVFLHTTAKPLALEKLLAERLGSLSVTVFGRFPDFETGLRERRPDAVVAPAALLANLGLPSVLQGQNGDREWESYVLVSAGAALEGPLDHRVIGVVDLLGRASTQALVARLLGTANTRMKLVTKLDDLLPLLQLQAAEAVLLPAALVSTLSEQTRLSLHVRGLQGDARVGLAAVAVLNPAVRALVISRFQALDGRGNRAIGVERWRVR